MLGGYVVGQEVPVYVPPRLSPRRKAALTFIAQDFAAYLIAYEPSLSEELADLPPVTNAATAAKAEDAYRRAWLRSAQAGPVTGQTAKDAPKLAHLADVLLNAKESFWRRDPPVVLPALVLRLTVVPDVGWFYEGTSHTPLWQATLRFGCEVVSDKDGQRLMSPRFSGSRWVMETFPAGTLK